MTAVNFHIKQEKFEGPLDLLLDLIEKERLEIAEISLAKVTDEYLAQIKKLEKIDPEELAEFLVIAAQLLLIKSRSLLPNLTLSPEEEVSIEELEKRLAEYQKIREYAKFIKNLETAGARITTREAYWGLEPIFYPPPGLSAQKIFDALKHFLESLPKLEELAEEKIKRIISIEEKINHIKSFLRGALEKGFAELVRGAKEKVEIIISFLALLELAKQKFIDLRQAKPFEDIVIKKL